MTPIIQLIILLGIYVCYWNRCELSTKFYKEQDYQPPKYTKHIARKFVPFLVFTFHFLVDVASAFTLNFLKQLPKIFQVLLFY